MIYLATPYSDDDPEVRESRFVAVNKAAAILMNSGEHVFSPISHSHPIKKEGNLPGSWDYWEEYDRHHLSMCDELCMFLNDGWEESTGFENEARISIKEKKKLSYILPGDKSRAPLPEVEDFEQLKVLLVVASGVRMAVNEMRAHFYPTIDKPADVPKSTCTIPTPWGPIEVPKATPWTRFEDEYPPEGVEILVMVRWKGVGFKSACVRDWDGKVFGSNTRGHIDPAHEQVSDVYWHIVTRPEE